MGQYSYRFHDVFHLSYAAILGWSPVTRAILKCKRKSDSKVDEVEDGGRATVIEEGISAFVYDYARKHAYLESIASPDYQLLKTIKALTSDLEVNECSSGDWERSILEGYKVWRGMKKNKGGYVSVDLNRQTISYQKP